MPHERVVDAFREHWKRVYGYECSLLVKPLEFMQLEQQLKGHSEAVVMKAIDAYFSTTDTYVLGAKHPLPLFLRDPLRYLAKEARVIKRPSGCQHQPFCADAAAHTKREIAERKVSA